MTLSDKKIDKICGMSIEMLEEMKRYFFMLGYKTEEEIKKFIKLAGEKLI